MPHQSTSAGIYKHELTIEDILNHKKEEIKAYLKHENQKVSGSKH